jgi:hypothetical protein
MSTFSPIYKDSRIPYIRVLIRDEGYAPTYWNMRYSGYSRLQTLKMMLVAKMSLDAWL